jgi:hypothetical protein
MAEAVIQLQIQEAVHVPLLVHVPAVPVALAAYVTPPVLDYGSIQT